MRKWFITAAAALAVAILFVPGTARATFAVQIVTTAGSKTVFDGGAGDLDGSVNNSITVNYSDSAYHLVGTISFTNAPGTANFAILDISYTINTVGTTGGAASLAASATGFTAPTGNPLFLVSDLNGNGHGTGTMTGQSYVDTNNGLFATSGGGVSSSGPQGPFPINSGYGNTVSTSFNGSTPPYSLTSQLNFNLSTNSNTSGDMQSTVTTPAPAALVLALSGLPVLGFGFLRRRRLQA
jgi:hypothetical protein